VPGEFDFINWVQSQNRPSAFVLVPPGDDLAVLRWQGGDLLLVGVDQVLDGVHFDASIHPPRLIGRKVVNRNLSDCAAMACLPAGLVVAAALPAGSGIDYARELYLGMREAADPFECPIVGGDTGSWPGRLALSVTVLGRSAGVAPITRAGAQAGDGIFVTGALGGSILGRHMTFAPRVELARELARTGRVTAMIDLSDGLSRDLRHICELSGVGATLEAERVPIHLDAIQLSARDGRDPLEHALHDGEDHELLFTASAEPNVTGITRIGTIHADRRIALERNGQRQDLAPRGWQHSL
jgi:thiamine-monophosphate kinase